MINRSDYFCQERLDEISKFVDHSYAARRARMSAQPEKSFRLPLLSPSRIGQIASSKTTQIGIAVWLIIGIGLRFWYWTTNRSVWHDEAALIINVFDLSYREMFGTLKLHLPAPPLFLVIERVVYQLLGEHQLALRFVPWAASCLALIFFADVCLGLLDRRGAIWAVALFAVSDRLLWHAQEAKTYSTDVLVAVMTLWLWMQTRHSTLVIRCFVGILLFPIVQWFCFPACFLAGMWLMLILPDLLKSKRLRDWSMYMLSGLLIGASFLALLWGPIEAQRSQAMDSCWTHQFPNWNKPWFLPFWYLTQTLELLRYLLMPTGQLFIGATVVGGIALAWRKEYRLLGACLLPFFLGIVASLMMKYPYGGARVCLFMMPGLLVLLGVGIPLTLDWAKRQSPWLLMVGGLILAIPFGYTAYRLAYPWPREEHASACFYIAQNMTPDEIVCSAHWETQYYLRNYRNRQDLLPDLTKTRPDSFWFLTTMKPDELQAVTTGLLTEYHIKDAKEFSTVQVLRFQKKSP